MSVRQALLWVHLVLGVTGSIILVVLGVTGAYITFQEPLAAAINPVPRVAPGPALDAAALIAAVDRAVAPQRVASLDLPHGDRAAVVRLRNRDVVFVNPADGAIVGRRPWRTVNLSNVTRVMRRLHIDLVMGRKGVLLVTAATLESLLLVLTGLWLWWRKKWWRAWPWRGSVFRVSWDLHNAMGIWFAVPVLVMAITGLLIAMPQPVYRLAGAPPAPWPAGPRSLEPTPGAVPIGVARAVALADSVRPGIAVSVVTVPVGPTGAFTVRKGGEVIHVDQFRGAVLAVRPDRVPTAGDEAYAVVEQAHTGELFGLPGRVVLTLGSLMLAAMSLTGLVLGWKRLLILAGRRSGE